MAAFATRRAPLMPLAGLGIVLVAAIGAFLISHNIALGDEAINRSIEIRVRLADLRRAIATQNAGYRGYLLAGGEAEKQEQEGANRSIAIHYNRLARLMTDAGQRDDLAMLGPLLSERVHNMNRRMAERRSHGFRSQADKQRQRQRWLIAEISRRLETMSVEEQRLLEQREREKLSLVRSLSAALAGAVLLVVAAAFLTVRDARQRFLALRNATRAARLSAAAAASEVAARQEVEAQLRQVQKMESIGQLTGGIAHDFNNMLAVIVGNLDLARRRVDQPDKVSRHISDALEGASRATTLVSRLLAFSRRQPLNPSRIDINVFLADLCAMLERVLGETIKVEADLQAIGEVVFADPVQLENSLLNLAVNARDAMDGGGILRLSTASCQIAPRQYADLPPGDYLEIAVADSGSGMDDGVLARAFDPFFTTKPVGKGTGLGLSQVFGFVRQSGGHVVIESSVGIGTCIRLLLPRGLVAGEVTKAPAIETAQRLGRSFTILLAEDDARVRNYSADALTELGHVPLAAPDGSEALDLLARNADIALLLTDVVMPGMSGPELATAVRSARPGVRVLYTTGYARAEDGGEAITDLDAPVLRKPFSVSELDAMIRDVMAR